MERETSTISEKIVCIVGADNGGGHIARELAMQLVQNEDCRYRIRVPLRDMRRESCVRLWRHIQSQHPEKLQLEEIGGELASAAPEKLDSLFHECSTIFHLIAPDVTPENPLSSERMDSEVKATRNVVNALIRKTVPKYVQVTPLSMCLDWTRPETIPSVVREINWLGNTAPEERIEMCPPDREARDMLRDHGILMVSVHPGIIMGPIIPKQIHRDSDTFRAEFNNEDLLGPVEKLFQSFLSGKAKSAPNYVAGFVSVIDVAHFLILAEQKGPIGRHIGENDRFILSSTTESYTDICKKLKQYFSNYDIPLAVESGSTERRKTFEVNGSLIRELLGMKYDLPYQFIKELGADILDLKFQKRMPIAREQMKLPLKV